MTDSLQLLCEVDGAFPEPKVEFLDGAGTRIPPEDTQTSVEEQRSYVKASVQVTQTGTFTCVVTQEQIHRQTSATTFIHTCGQFGFDYLSSVSNIPTLAQWASAVHV